MKYFFRQNPCPVDDTDELVDSSRLTLLEELAQTRAALEIAYSGFDNVTDPDLIDCYIYEVNSIMKRYRYLLQRAAEQSPLPHEVYSASYCTPAI